jgi:hypothetical protein
MKAGQLQPANKTGANQKKREKKTLFKNKSDLALFCPFGQPKVPLLSGFNIVSPVGCFPCSFLFSYNIAHTDAAALFSD